MARYETTIESRLSQADAFDYMAEFTNAREWDPRVGEARRVEDGPVAVGSAFELVARFAGKDVPLRYTVLEYDRPRRVVLEARRPGFVSRDTITVAEAAAGSTVHYDALLELSGWRRLFGPFFQRTFDGIGDRAAEGMRAALNQ
ncbi:MAG TPA: SRPBCC family protein [Gaiellaceae bacterium]|jgi:hypothetical protein|nr:SRPBCC family protein [Gaiellaceae bacterium]